jgi:hypothetical protein
MATPGQHDHLNGFEDFLDPPFPEGVEGSDDDEPGGAYLRRPGELLVAADDVDEAEERLAGNDFRRRDPGADELDIQQLGIEVALVDDVTGALDALDRHRGRTLRVAPNHVFHPAWKFRWQTFEPPRPASGRADIAGELRPGEHGAVAVLDTGAADHPWFAGRVDIGPGNEEAPDEDGDDRLDDNRGHGTFVVGVVLVHAPGARVRAVRVPERTAGQEGAGGLVDDLTLARTLLALDDVDVVNLSLGGATRGDAAPPALAAALALIHERRPDTVIVAAAGNDGWDRPTWPAAFKGVLAVGALDVDGRPASFSNRGWWIDAWAPGVDVQSTFLDWEGPLAHPLAGDDAERFDGWASWCGTSFASPRVAGAIAAAAPGAGGARRAAFELLTGGTAVRGFHGVTVDVPEHP